MANAKISMSQSARNYPIQATKNGLVGWAGGQCEGYVIGKKALHYAFTCACSRDSLKSRTAMSVKYFFPKFSWRKWLSGLSTSSRLNSDWAQSSNQSYSIHPMRINYSYLTQIVSKALKCNRFFYNYGNETRFNSAAGFELCRLHGRDFNYIIHGDKLHERVSKKVYLLKKFAKKVKRTKNFAW